MSTNALLAGVLSSAFFIILNCAINIYTKWLFSEDGGAFPLPWTVLAVQQLQAYLVLQFCLAWTGISGKFGWALENPRSDLDDGSPSSVKKEEPHDSAWVHVAQVLAVTGLFCVNVGLNSLSLVRISITLNQTVRACLPVGVLLFASCLEQRTYPRHSYFTTVVLIAGVAVTCWGNPGFELEGFLLVLASTLVAALGSSLNGRLLSSGPFCGSGPDKIMRLVMLQSLPAFFVFGMIAACFEFKTLMTLLQMDAKANGPFSTANESLTKSLLQLLGLISISSGLALLSNLGRCFLVASTSALMETFAGNLKVALLCVVDNRFFGTVLYSYNYVGIFVTFFAFSAHLLMQYISPAESLPEESSYLRVDGVDVVSDAADGKSPTTEPAVHKRPSKGLPLCLLVSGAETGLIGEHAALRLGRKPAKNRAQPRYWSMPTDTEGSDAEDRLASRLRRFSWAPGEDESSPSISSRLAVVWQPALDAPSWLDKAASASPTSAGSLSSLAPTENSRSCLLAPEETQEAGRNRFYTDFR